MRADSVMLIKPMDAAHFCAVSENTMAAPVAMLPPCPSACKHGVISVMWFR